MPMIFPIEMKDSQNLDWRLGDEGDDRGYNSAVFLDIDIWRMLKKIRSFFSMTWNTRLELRSYW